MHELPAEVPSIWHSPAHRMANLAYEHDKQWIELVLADAPYADEFLGAYVCGTTRRPQRKVVIKTLNKKRKAKAKRPKAPEKQLSLFPRES